MPRRCIRVSGTSPDGQPFTGIVTVFEQRRSCSSCGKGATLRCDYPVVPRGRKAGTCDRWICSSCATTVGDDLHYCPPHERASRLPGVE